ncbi:MAG: hypothetical protein BMS9Abin09_0894 [Gammaproteobacteria bacterium]|nr:MAG: hypothetical protein BMS9Abin09_0894 [Gammaproteobacteria bacterium]
MPGSVVQIRYLVSAVFGFLLLIGVPLSTIASDDFNLSLPKHRILADELAIIINDADPLSVRIGNYYRKARNIPARNVLHVDFRPGRPNMGKAEFRRIKALIDRQTPANVQAYAITWAAPFRVNCMSITSAFAFGFDKRFCSSQRCAPTQHSRYFGRPSAMPYTDFGIRPTIAIAAENFAEAKALIDRGVMSDKTRPSGTAYLVSTSDRARNVRSTGYTTVKSVMTGWINTSIVESEALENINDILFYFTGKTSVPYLDTLQFVPGAIADHLTSGGGKLINGKQMSALRWLEAGATGSYGTVVEPCNLTGKFPNPGELIDVYGSGRTLLQAYWQSVQQPGEGIFIGAPLAAPFDGFTLKVQDRSILLRTRTLIPGRYRLLYSKGPIGPYRALPGVIEARYHQRRFTLPNAGAGYYRLEHI